MSNAIRGFLGTILSSPTKNNAREASSVSEERKSSAGPSSSPTTIEAHPNRVQKSRKSATPVSARKERQRAERLATHVRTNSPLQEVCVVPPPRTWHEVNLAAGPDGLLTCLLPQMQIVNEKAAASRRQSAPAKPAATPREKPAARRGRLSTIPQVSGLTRDEDEDDNAATVFASQPADVNMASALDADSQSQDKDEVVRGSQGKSSVEERPTSAGQDVSAVARDLVQAKDAGIDPYDLDADKDMDEDMFTFTNLLAHRWSGDEIEIKVDWHGDEATWEPETTLHSDAPDALFAYWRAQGGRPENPRDAGLYDIFAIRKHNRNKTRLLVEWTGYPPEDNTWETKAVLEETAPEILAEYLESVKPATKRGSKKKN